MRISDWSSDVCSSDLRGRQPRACRSAGGYRLGGGRGDPRRGRGGDVRYRDRRLQDRDSRAAPARRWIGNEPRSEEHTSELQSLMRNSYAVFCLKKKKIHNDTVHQKDTESYVHQHNTTCSHNEIEVIVYKQH